MSFTAKKRPAAQLNREIAEALAHRGTGIDTTETLDRKFQSRQRDALTLAEKARQARGAAARWMKRSSAYAQEGQFREADDAQTAAMSLGRMAADLDAEVAHLRTRSHATVKQPSRHTKAMTTAQFNALATRATETLLQGDFDALVDAVRKLQPKTIVGVHGDYGGKEGVAEGRFIELVETSSISAPWSRRVIVEEVEPTSRLQSTLRRLDVSPYDLWALPKTKFRTISRQGRS